MKTKVVLLVSLMALSALFSLAGAVAAADIDYGPKAKYLPSNGEMNGWVKQLWAMGVHDEYGYRMPGTLADLQATHWIRDKFQSYGMTDISLEPVPASFSFPDTWSLEVNGRDVPCYFLRYPDFTPAQGITAQMVYAGAGSDVEFDAVPGGVAGKIVVVDIIAPPTPFSVFQPAILFKYDPDNTLAGDNGMENWPPVNFDSSYQKATARGAVGFVAVLTFTVETNNQFLHAYFPGLVPGVSVSPPDGAYIKNRIAAGPVQAKLTLTGQNESGSVYNVYGTLPGKNYGTSADRFIMVETHHDGWAANEASGTAVVLGIAQYLSHFPSESRNYSIVFCALASHFGLKAGWDTYPMKEYRLIQEGKIKCAFPIEMVGKQFKLVDGRYISTERISPTAIMIDATKSSAAALIPIARSAMLRYQLERRALMHYAHGETMKWRAAGVPFIGHISHNAPQFTSDDTPNTVMVEALRPTTAAFADMIQAVDSSF